VDGHSARWRIDPQDRYDLLLFHPLINQEVTGLDQLGGCEAPLVAAADHERVLGRCLHPAVDDHEAVVLADTDAGDARCDGRRAVQAVVREPVVLGAVGNIDLKAGHLDGCHVIAGLEVLDRREAAVLEAHERAEEEAVAARTRSAGAGTTGTRSAGTGPTGAGATTA